MSIPNYVSAFHKRIEMAIEVANYGISIEKQRHDDIAVATYARFVLLLEAMSRNASRAAAEQLERLQAESALHGYEDDEGVPTPLIGEVGNEMATDVDQTND